MQFLFSQEKEDLVWSDSTDFSILNGDLEDTRNYSGKGFIQEVFERIHSSKNDWKLAPEKGATLEQFEGEVNNQDTWNSMAKVLSQELTRDMFLLKSDFEVHIAPLSLHEVGIRIDFVEEIVYNFSEETKQLNMVYNTDTNRAFIVG